MDNKEVWVSNEVFEWFPPAPEGGRQTSDVDLIRAYDLWSHAESLITKEKSEFHLVDAISTLKRCLNQRLKFIEYVYGLKQIVLSNSPKGYLEYLETFNLVRPMMLKKLMEIRNDIEHQDAEPPTVDRCGELLDLTWYFLKSTDSILKNQWDSIVYENVDEDGRVDPYGFSLDIDYDLDHKMKISGWFPIGVLSETERDNHTKISVETIHTKEQFAKERTNQDRLSTDTFIVGELLASNEIKHTILQGVLRM